MSETGQQFDDHIAGAIMPDQILFGNSPEMNVIRRTLDSVAKTNIPLLIQGESGTGKEVCTHYVHNFSQQRSRRLVKVVCPAIPNSLLETELFGYERGAFTGAVATKRGRIEEANGGTLFLDEIGSLELSMQSKLLQVLQDGTFSRVGGHDIMSIDTRLISVSNQDLRDKVADGSFRLDFLYRINAVTVTLLPLRERLDDLPSITSYFLHKYAALYNSPVVPIPRSMMVQMRRYSWPGNFRQLENLIQRYVLVGDNDHIMDEMISESPAPESLLANLDLSEPTSLKQVTKRATHELEKQIILKVLRANSWNRQRTARWLKMSYRSLLYKLSELGWEEAPRLRRTRAEIEASEQVSQAKPSSQEPSTPQ